MSGKLSVVFALCAVAVSASVVWLCFTVQPILKRVDTASHQLLDCTWVDSTGRARSNPACLQASLLAITGSIKDSAGTVTKALPDIAQSAKKASDNSVETSKQMAELAKAGVDLVHRSQAVVAEVKQTVTDLDTVVIDLDKSVKDLTGDGRILLQSSDDVIKDAGKALVKLGELEDELQRQLKADGPEALKTLQAMRALLEDKALMDTMQNISDGTYHLAETAKTFDIATVGLRKKASVVKLFINKLIDAFIHVVPFLK